MSATLIETLIRYISTINNIINTEHNNCDNKCNNEYYKPLLLLIKMIIIIMMQTNTFQCIIATDGTMTFSIFLYNKTEWTTQNDINNMTLNAMATPAKVGFNAGVTIITLPLEQHPMYI